MSLFKFKKSALNEKLLKTFEASWLELAGVIKKRFESNESEVELLEERVAKLEEMVNHLTGYVNHE